MAAHIFSESGQMQEVDIPDIFDVLEGGEDESAVKYLLGFGGEDSGIEPGQITIETQPPQQPQQQQQLVVSLASPASTTGSSSVISPRPCSSTETKGPKSGKRDTSGLKAIYKCQNCPKAFTTKFNLRRHINMHCHKSKEIGVPIQGPPSASAPSKKPNKAAHAAAAASVAVVGTVSSVNTVSTSGPIPAAVVVVSNIPPIATTNVQSFTSLPTAAGGTVLQTQQLPLSSNTTQVTTTNRLPVVAAPTPPNSSSTSKVVTYQVSNPGVTSLTSSVTPTAPPAVQLVKTVVAAQDPNAAAAVAAAAVPPPSLASIMPQTTGPTPAKAYVQNVAAAAVLPESRTKVDTPSPTPSLNLSPSMFPLMNSLPEAPMQVFQDLNPPLVQSSSSVTSSTSSSTSCLPSSTSVIPTASLSVNTSSSSLSSSSSKPLSSFLQSAFSSPTNSSDQGSKGSGQLLQIATPSKLAAALPNFTVTLNASVVPDEPSAGNLGTSTDDGATQQPAGDGSTTLLITATLDPRQTGPTPPQYLKTIDRIPNGWVRKVVRPDYRGQDPLVFYFSSSGKRFGSVEEIEQHFNRLGHGVSTDIFNYGFSKEELHEIRSKEEEEAAEERDST